MKTLFLIFALTALTYNLSHAQSKFELEPSQSMLMTGKGKGQDGAINPFYGQDCYAIVENSGSSEFSVRIQKKGKVIKNITLSAQETKRIKLLKDQELYIDTNALDKASLKLDFEKIEN